MLCFFSFAFAERLDTMRGQMSLADSYAKDIHRTESSFVRKLEFKHRLRVCNAYGAPLTIVRAKLKLTDPEMAYKECRQFSIQLLTGDKLEFHVGESNGGTFAVASMPENDAVLLLVLSRHDSLSSAVSFESHIFANLAEAQVAVIDTYRGKNGGTVRIQDHNKNHSSRSELLRYDSVVAVNPGTFDCVLYGKDGIEKNKKELVARNQEAYVILRVGVESQEGGVALPEEIIVFPQSVSFGSRSYSFSFVLVFFLGAFF